VAVESRRRIEVDMIISSRRRFVIIGLGAIAALIGLLAPLGIHRWRGQQRLAADPNRKYLLSVLSLAENDNASALLIGGSGGKGSPIRYNVGGRWYDFSPPPAKMLPLLRAQLERLAALPGGPFPRRGIITARGLRFRWRVTLEGADADYVLTPRAQ
jgi:hypothetical protein